MVRIPKYFGTCLCTSSQRNSPSLCCKVVVYSVNYSFCLKQISLNQFWNRISIISISYSCTSMWLQKEFTLLHGQFLTVRCEHYQICVKKSWSEFNQILCRHSIAPKLAKCLQFEVCQICGLVLQCVCGNYLPSCGVELSSKSRVTLAFFLVNLNGLNSSQVNTRNWQLFEFH